MTVLLMLVATLAMSPDGALQPTNATAAFEMRVADYLALRQRVKAITLPEHIVDPHIREISGPLLAAALQRARQNAAVGDVFSAPLSDLLRDRLHRALDDAELDLLMTQLYPNGLPPAGTVRVNATCRDVDAVVPPLSVLAALPPLPIELSYRMVGRDLVLWDVDARLVVDLVADALPMARVWRFLELSLPEVRERVRGAIASAGLSALELVDEMRDDTIAGAVPPAIGEPLSWRLGSMMPPSVLYALPDLPQPLEYRLVLTDLVVVDVRANLVIAIVKDVLPHRARAPRA